MLYPEYDVKSATMVKANSIEDLIYRIKGINKSKALKTIFLYNNAVTKNIKFDPTIKDGKKTIGLKINKTNWANLIDKPPILCLRCYLWNNFYLWRIKGK